MFTTGTADGHIDLLEKVRKYLVDEVGWTELFYDGTPSPSPGDDLDNVRLCLRGPGATVGNEYFLNIQAEYRTSDSSYGWRMSAATDYDSLLADAAQEMATPFVYFNTWQNHIDYWIYASDRRFIVVAKCNTSYMSMYAGLFLPYALPTEYLKPFCLIGNSDRLEPYNVNDAGNQMIANPAEGASWVLNLSGNDWLSICNQGRQPNSDIKAPLAREGVVWPHRTLGSSNDTSADARSWNWHGWNRIRPNLQGESPQFLCQLMCHTENHLLGALDGVYSIAGFGRTSEQLLSFGSPSRSYRVFQNVFRTTPRDFMSIEEY